MSPEIKMMTENQKIEKFQIFINELKEATQRKCERFENFVKNIRKLKTEAEKAKIDSFKNFIDNVKQLIYNEVESLDKTEKKLFKLLTEFKEGETNIFEAFGYKEEIYRDFLVWLLDKECSHGLKYEFTKLFVNHIVKRITKEKEKEKEIESELINSKIGKEVPLKGKSIDFMITGESFLCAVEMKLRSRPSKRQLENYEGTLLNKNNENKNLLKKNNENENQGFKKTIYEDKEYPNSFGICLSFKKPINEEKFNELKLFKPMSWWEVVLCLSEICEKAPTFFVKELIKQFIKRVFFFVETISDLPEKDEILAKKRLFDIYMKIKKEKGG